VLNQEETTKKKKRNKWPLEGGMVDLTSRSWTGAERLHWREQITPPLAVTSLIFCVLAAVIYYIFPRLRVFPRSILAWINIYNIIQNAYFGAKWFPSSNLHDPMVVHLKSGSAACRAGLFLDNLTIHGAVACDTLIALTVFLVVKMGVNLEAKTSCYHVAYLLFAIGYPLLMALVAAFGFSTETAIGNPCVVGSAFGQGLITYPSLFLVLFQFILLIWAMAYVHRVMNSIKSSHGSNFPVKYLLVRFLATFLAQLYNIFPLEMYMLFPHIQSNAIFARFAFFSHVSGGAVDAIILILANVDFMNWVRTKWDKNWKSDSNSEPATASPTSVTLSMSNRLSVFPKEQEESDVNNYVV